MLYYFCEFERSTDIHYRCFTGYIILSFNYCQNVSSYNLICFRIEMYLKVHASESGQGCLLDGRTAGKATAVDEGTLIIDL